MLAGSTVRELLARSNVAVDSDTTEIGGLVKSTMADGSVQWVTQQTAAEVNGALSHAQPGINTAQSSHSSSTAPDMWVEDISRFTAAEMEAAYTASLNRLSREETLVCHFTTHKCAEMIIAPTSRGVRASSAGQMGGGLSVCLAPPHALGWAQWGKGDFRATVGKALWGEKWKDVLEGGKDADKVSVVLFIKLPKYLLLDTCASRRVPGREHVFIIPPIALTEAAGAHWLPRDNILKAYQLMLASSTARQGGSLASVAEPAERPSPAVENFTIITRTGKETTGAAVSVRLFGQGQTSTSDLALGENGSFRKHESDRFLLKIPAGQLQVRSVIYPYEPSRHGTEMLSFSLPPSLPLPASLPTAAGSSARDLARQFALGSARPKLVP